MDGIEKWNKNEDTTLTGYPSIDKPWLKYYKKEQIEKILPQCSMYEYVKERCKEYLENTAFNYFGKKISYHSLFDDIENAAKSFGAIGIREGDIVPIISVTLPEIIYSFYGLNRIGAISNMIDPRTSVAGIRDYIQEVNAKVIIVIDAAYQRVVEAAEGTTVERIISVSPADSLRFPKRQLYRMKKGIKVRRCDLTWEGLLALRDDSVDIVHPYKKDECATIVHTGGTTGMPKGVMLSNDNLNAAAEQALNSLMPLESKDVFLNVMPPFIAYGIVLGIHTAIAGGWEQVLIPVFDPDKFDDVILKYRPAAAMGVPTHFDKVISSKKLAGKDLSYIRCLLVGGDKIRPEFEESINSFLFEHGCNLQVSKGYSMTEASSTATFSFGESNKIGSAGIPLPKTIVAAFDEESGEEKQYNEIGLLHIQTPTMMLGYYGKDEETNQVLIKKADGSKWIYTGDYGYVDEDGIVFVEGRSKRMLIRYDGFKVFPPLIEKVVEKNCNVQNSCVVGKKDPEHSQGKLPVVYAVLKENADKESVKSNLIKLCKEELPEYAQPTDFIFIEQMPLTPIGKVDYRALEEKNGEE